MVEPVALCLPACLRLEGREEGGAVVVCVLPPPLWLSLEPYVRGSVCYMCGGDV